MAALPIIQNPSHSAINLCVKILFLHHNTNCMQICSFLSEMASKFISTFVLTLVLFCFLLMSWETSGCGSVHACFDATEGSLKEIPNRKMRSGLKDKKNKVSLEGSSRIKYGEKPLIGELRKVPTGPDPLHHHSIGNPVRPETP